MAVEPHKKEAASLACDLARQFVNIAVAGIAFAVGLSFASNISLCLFWAILIVLGLSAASGLLFLMHSIALLCKDDLDVTRPSLRLLSASQILLTAVGVVLLCVSIL